MHGFAPAQGIGETMVDPATIGPPPAFPEPVHLPVKTAPAATVPVPSPPPAAAPPPPPPTPGRVYYPPHPWPPPETQHTKMRPLTEVLLDGDWLRAGRCFIIGGGPSLIGFDWSLLDGERTIGCNKAYLMNPTVAICMDTIIPEEVLEWRPPYHFTPGEIAAFAAYRGFKVFFNTMPARSHREYPGFFVVENKGRDQWSETLADGLCSSSNIGITALNLADCLMGGSGTIYLLGFDCKGIDGKIAHWWDAPEKWLCSDGIYQRWFTECFRRASKCVRTKVVNLCPDSAVECFPKASWDAAFPEGIHGREACA